MYWDLKFYSGLDHGDFHLLMEEMDFANGVIVPGCHFLHSSKLFHDMWKPKEGLAIKCSVGIARMEAYAKHCFIGIRKAIEVRMIFLDFTHCAGPEIGIEVT